MNFAIEQMLLEVFLWRGAILDCLALLQILDHIFVDYQFDYFIKLVTFLYHRIDLHLLVAWSTEHFQVSNLKKSKFDIKLL
jgi:hypothetical protein